MTPLQKILAAYRATSQTEREKGTYFEELIRTYFRNEPRFVDLYSDVWLYTDWAKEIGGPQFHLSANDTGIDLVAKTAGTEEFHAIQCKCYAEDYRVRKSDIDSFITASGQKPFVQRIIVTTTNDWSENAENALIGQTPPVYKIDLHDLGQTDSGVQCFPLYLYDLVDDVPADSDDLFAPTQSEEPGIYKRRDAITDAGLAHFQAAYPAEGEGGSITKEDLFYYIYGLLHSPDYRSRYADNLGKELPRIPAVKTFADFRAFEKAGRELAHWHLNYETVECYAGVGFDLGNTVVTSIDHLATFVDKHFRVTKMKFAKTKDPETKKSVNDKTTVIYNDFITIRNIPLEAYDYVVNGKPALEWVMERQAVTTDKDSGITNDANLWATETMGNAKYPLELFLRVITVSLETNRIVAGLPGLEFSVESSS